MGRRLLQLRVSTLCGCTIFVFEFFQVHCDLCSSPSPRAELTGPIRSVRTRRSLHWQSVRTFAAFGKRSTGVELITCPAQWLTYRAISVRSGRRAGKRSPSVRLSLSRRRGGAAPAAPSSNQETCSQHRRRGSCRNRAPELHEKSGWHECVRRGLREK